MARHQAARRAGEAPVRKQRHLLAKALPHQRRRDRQHLAHARTARGTLVADDHDVAGLDRLRRHRRHRRLLGLEDAGRPAVLAPLVARDLHDAAVRREVAAQDGQPSALRQRIRQRADDLLAGRLRRIGGVLGQSPARDRLRVAVQQPGLEQALRHQRHAARLVQVDRDEPAARLEVADERRLRRDGVEIVDRQRDARLARDRQEVEHAVGRAAAAGDASPDELSLLVANRRRGC